MVLPSRLLFWAPALIWGSTWHVILYQIDQVPAAVAVVWRFLLAALLMFAVLAWRRERFALAPRWHAALALTGALQYGLNYLCVYEAERHVPSGLVAVLYSLMVFGNALGGWLAFRQRVERHFLAGGALGVLGVVLVFWPEVAAAGARPDGPLGLACGLGGVLAACIGNACTLALTRRGLSLIPVLAWSMAYGAAILLAAAIARGLPLAPGATGSWWLSLVYLAAFGSVAAFLLYFKLGQRRGPAVAALTAIVTPPVALLLSALFEGWRVTPAALAGVGLALAGVYLATRAPRATPLNRT